MPSTLQWTGAREGILVRDIVSHEHRVLGKVRAAQTDECISLVRGVVRDDVDHVFAVCHFSFGTEPLQILQQLVTGHERFHRLPVMQRHRVPFVLYNDARKTTRGGRDHWHPLVNERRG